MEALWEFRQHGLYADSTIAELRFAPDSVKTIGTYTPPGHCMEMQPGVWYVSTGESKPKSRLKGCKNEEIWPPRITEEFLGSLCRSGGGNQL
jgi:hypothetical protein